MPYAIVEDKIAEISPQYRGELLAFIDFLLYRQSLREWRKSSHRIFGIEAQDVQASAWRV